MAAAPGEPLPFKQMAKVLFAPDGEIKKSGKCALVIDANDNPMAGTFLKYRDVNLVDACNPVQMLTPETLRLALLGSLRFGKPFVLDVGNNPDLMKMCAERFDEVKKGLLDLILTNKITEEDEFKQIVKKNDPPEYSGNNYYLVENYSFIILTTNPQVSKELLDKTYPVHIVM